ncbi:hypothetical protein PHLCEN_2v6495 [Hermanssonia centrifuga]|uniref:F-box domain-containing protein n=1 Tax=Hermanssonia centrifuga TaxID=98765 RepID=A0A2R6NZB3_9APHY|nr:hypothetical protein PHLCEN_2v6495 [Hermanssonia centrifuga]
MDVHSVFAGLPTELLCEVFEHAAVADKSTALALSLVSSWTRQLVDPLLFRTVALSTSHAVEAFVFALSKKPDAFANSHVKHLGIFALGPVEAIDKVLDACKGVDSLACGFSLPGYKHLHGCDTMQALEAPKEQHLLGLSCRDGWDIGLVVPTVTHLRIHVSSPQTFRSPPALPGNPNHVVPSGSPSWDSLSYLPALTHLAVVYQPSKSCPATSILAPLQNLLAPSGGHPDDAAPRPRLALVLIQVTGTRSSTASAVKALNNAAMAQGGDALRIVAERAPSSAVSQWEQAVRGGRGVWENAEMMVHQRLAAAKQQLPTSV